MATPLLIQELLKIYAWRTLLFRNGKWIISSGDGNETDFEKLKLSKTMKEIFKERLRALI